MATIDSLFLDFVIHFNKQFNQLSIEEIQSALLELMNRGYNNINILTVPYMYGTSPCKYDEKLILLTYKKESEYGLSTTVSTFSKDLTLVELGVAKANIAIKISPTSQYLHKDNIDVDKIDALQTKILDSNLKVTLERIISVSESSVGRLENDFEIEFPESTFHLQNKLHVTHNLTSEDIIKKVCCFDIMKENNMECLDNICFYPKSLQKKAIVNYCLYTLTELIGNYYNDSNYLSKRLALNVDDRLTYRKNKLYNGSQESLENADFFEMYKKYYISSDYSVFNEAQFRQYISKIISIVDTNFPERSLYVCL
ncbi:hypothetical protein [Paenibacillus sp. FSL E2-0201]|uniref:hypothetical protein n=1 Tax=Paenibacillus sp. FSL E2-0201 TaxID=2954726 RepID=UPI0030DDC033